MSEEQNKPTAPDFAGEKMKMPENTDLPDTEPTKQSIVNGPLLFTLGILLLVILAGLFYWYTTILNQPQEVEVEEVTRPTPEENNEPESTTAEAEVETMGAVSTSDELSAIESDLEGTMLDEIDAEINAIEAELDAAVE